MIKAVRAGGFVAQKNRRVNSKCLKRVGHWKSKVRRKTDFADKNTAQHIIRDGNEESQQRSLYASVGTGTSRGRRGGAERILYSF